MIGLLIIFAIGLRTSVCQNATADSTTNALSSMCPEDNFYYFAYGSNLLAARIHINNPSAVRLSAAKLKNYRLDFGYWSKRWKGAAATIVAEEGEHVWGAVWQMDSSDREHLDRQEGVEDGIYFPFEVEVETPSGGLFHCRCYQLCNTPSKLIPGQPVPDDRLPSELYMSVIIKGAQESNIPDDYIDHLRAIPHNNYKGDNNTKLSSLISS